MLRFAITNRVAGPGSTPPNSPPDGPFAGLLAEVERWSSDAVDYILLREKQLAPADLRGLIDAAVLARDRGHDLRPSALATAVPRSCLLVHTSSDPSGEIAAIARADGVHLPGSWSRSWSRSWASSLTHPPDRSPKQPPQPAAPLLNLDTIRDAFARSGRPRPVISASCHTVEEVRSAADAGVDLILFGPVFGKVVHGVGISPGVGLTRLQQACQAAPRAAILALGGVTAEAAPACLEVGAAGIAGIRLFEPTNGARTGGV